MSISEKNPIRVAIIGAGISGLAQAIRLKENLGTRAEVTIYERESRAGGIWRDATWPGAGVDIPIHFYSLFSDLKPDWKSVYASQPEVLEYWEGLIDKYHLRSSINYSKRYVSSTWVEDEQSHAIVFEQPEPSFAGTAPKRFTVVADFLISATGPLAKPEIPDVPGLASFRGKYFHNLKWDKSVVLEGKRIAVLGNGSSGIQLVPGVAALPGTHVTQFIRSGAYFLPKVNSQYSACDKWAFTYIPFAQRLNRAHLFFSAWISPVQWPPIINSREALQERLLKHLRDTAPPEYLEALTPHYPLGCKRLAYDDGWLETLHRKNVDLISDPVVRISEDGIHTANGGFFPLDVIIFATGSDVAQFGLGLNVGLKGQDGLELREYWDSLGGPEAYLGVAVPHFPNYFIVLGPNGSAGSWGYSSGIETALISRLIKETVDNGLSSIQPTAAAFEAHNEKVQKGFAHSPITSDACHSWYNVGSKITVPNSVSTVGLWWETRKTRFGDWTGTKRVAGTSQLETVNIQRLVRKRKVRKAAVVTAVLAIVGLVEYFGWAQGWVRL